MSQPTNDLSENKMGPTHKYGLFKSEMRAMAVNDATETYACPVASNITQFTDFKVHRNCETPI